MVLLQFAFFVRLYAPIPFQDGDTALMLACGGGHVEVVKALLGAEPRANIEAKRNVGVLSMHLHSPMLPSHTILIVKAINIHAPHLLSGWRYGPFVCMCRRSCRGRQGIVGCRAHGRHTIQEECGYAVHAL